MATAIDNWLDRRPDPALLEQAVAPYLSDVSARSYLDQLGVIGRPFPC
jgi:hypothetical protein